MTSRRRSFLARASRLALALSAVTSVGVAQAQTTTKMLVGFPAGGARSSSRDRGAVRRAPRGGVEPG